MVKNRGRWIAGVLFLAVCGVVQGADSEPVKLLAKAHLAEKANDYKETVKLTQRANRIWQKKGARTPEYAESLVLLSLAMLGEEYSAHGKKKKVNTEQMDSRWRAESADSLAVAVDVCRANPGSKPEVLALALELQSLQASDKGVSQQMRDEAGTIRGTLTQAILPAPPAPGLAGVAELPPLPQRAVYAPTLASKVEPAYSEAARILKVMGTVHLALVVEKDGTPSSVQLMRGLGFGLDEEAAKAVKQWRFHPGMVDGKPARVVVQVEVNFRIA